MRLLNYLVVMLMLASYSLAGTNILDASGNVVYTDIQSLAVATAVSGDQNQITVRGQTTAAVQVTAVATTLQFEGSVAGGVYFAVPCVVPATGALVTSTTTTGIWHCDIAGSNVFRVRQSAAGSSTISIIASQGASVVYGVTGFTQGALTSGQLGNLAMGAVTTAAPAYTTAQSSPLSLATNGGLRSDINSIIGTTAVAASAGVLKVGVVGNAGAIFDGATAAAVPANALYHGARAATANPTNATGGNTVGIMADKAGKQVTTAGCPRELVGMQTTTISASTAETTIVTAGGANVFNDISSMVFTTTDAAVATVSIRDATGGTIRAVYNYPATAANPVNPVQFTYPIPWAQTSANANWTATVSVNAGNVIINTIFCKNL
jgi:hypothetical protein